MDQNGKMLIQGQLKLRKFGETLEKRLEEVALEQGVEPEQNLGRPHHENEIDELMREEMIGGSKQPSLEDRDALLQTFVDKLQIFYEEEILGTLIDLVQDGGDDDEYYEWVHSHQT